MTSCFRPLLFTALAATVLAACAPQSSSPGTAQADGTATSFDGDVGPAPANARAQGALASSLSTLRSADAIAAYPDRGDLVGFDRVRKLQRNGGNTFYPVQVSEAHALAAIGNGTLLLSGPDGGQVRLKYERHVEHPTGDWSWVGRDEHGIEGILTFGEKAVFGVFPYGEDETMRLTTNAGQVWMAASTKGVLSPLDQRVRAGAAPPDFMVPPRTAAALSSEAAEVSEMLAGAAPVQAAAAGGTTIDLLLGYTPGFASMLGGASQAQTRLNHIVTVGNQAFANSNVAVNLRLVGTLQVNYADTGSNETTLEQLTGTNGQSSVTIPASLQPLRAARETYGADLVSLVRRFRDPAHEGCGIAWLVGGGQTPIVPGHEMYGYSAISDSNGMQAPDNGHYCRDETLVHELGHNLGSQHDNQAARGPDGNLDPDDYGRYPYSFGLKTSAANGNFYTVMAYGDAGQTAWRIFSNPESTYCGGRSCGIANQADNARSLRATAPLIAAFRASLQPPASATRMAVGSKFDANGDGRADILWRHDGNGNNTIWLSANVGASQAMARVPSLLWRVAGVGDFNGDGRSDVLWRDAGNGQNTIWLGGNSATTQAVARVADQNWSVAAVGDFNGDGRDDIVWRHAVSGANNLWHSANVASSVALARVADQRWLLAAVGDFNGDGRDDVVWRHTGDGSNTIWLGANVNTPQVVARVADLRWYIGAAGDFNGDGRSDLMWRQDGTGINSVWNQANAASSYPLARIADARWSVEAAGDYTGDGRADLLWRHSGTGGNSVWRSASANSSLAVATVNDLAWDVKP